METNEVAVVTNWPELLSVKDLKRSLGFANFYRHFIQGFSAVAAPLTDLLKGKKD